MSDVSGIPGKPWFETKGDEFWAKVKTCAAAGEDTYGLHWAVNNASNLVEASHKAAAVPERKKLDLATFTDTLVKAINPSVTIPRHVYAGITLPDRIRSDLLETGTFEEVLAYPDINKPMYEPLTKISPELFLPNINYVQQNSITLLEPNTSFIEAYMVGLNHEFARELLWREYPTDQRGSCFRQFWDISSLLSPVDQDSEARKDIPPLHLWPKDTELGKNYHSEENGEPREEVVLVVRGELLKKFPTAVIYAHRAIWQTVGGVPNTGVERRLKPVGLDRDTIRTPLYEAKVDPDIYFFGFDLTPDEVRGGSPEDSNPDAGWFFVFEERPGETRFGLDLGPTKAADTATVKTVELWNDLVWGDTIENEEPGKFIELPRGLPGESIKPIKLGPWPVERGEKTEQRKEDEQLKNWDQNTNAADLAYILCQVPVRVAVHAADMLPKPD